MKHQSLKKMAASRRQEQKTDEHGQVLSDETPDNILVNIRSNNQKFHALLNPGGEKVPSVSELYQKATESQERWHARGKQSSPSAPSRPKVEEVLEPLEEQLKSYNKSMMPSKPVDVIVQLQIKNSYPYDERAGSFMLDVYLRQIWYDSRLVHQLKNSSYSVVGNETLLHYIWEPDTVVTTTREIRSEKMLVDIGTNGRVFKSNHDPMKVEFLCKEKSTVTKICKLFIKSLSYNQTYIDYDWDGRSSSANSAVEIVDNSFPKAPYIPSFKSVYRGKSEKNETLLILEHEVNKTQTVN